jgi:signal transduction histidine kinase
MVAHEIGSPLAAIRGSLEVLATGELELAEQDEVFGKIRVETDRLSTLVADVGNAAAVESGPCTKSQAVTPGIVVSCRTKHHLL